jgi:hypothetical protein
MKFSDVKRLIALIMLTTAANFGQILHADTDPPSQVRITSSFEYKYTGAVLKKVAKLFSKGFTRADAEQLLRDITALPAEQSKVWDYQVLYKGNPYDLQVRVLIDDLGTLDMDFVTAPALAPAVRDAVDGYLNGRGF